MVYDWDAHQETCYQLYIKEGRSLEDIMEHMKAVYMFAPSKRAFQTQFRRWNFPSKQRPAYKNDRLVSRIKELWESNLSQREMLRVLNEEDGFDIKARELMRVRARYRWLLRVPNGNKARTTPMVRGPRRLNGGSLVVDGDDSTLPVHGENGNEEQSLRPIRESVMESSVELQKDSDAADNVGDDKADTRRRRRNRHPTDPSGSTSRFPSETTLDQARVILNLEIGTYKEIRSCFQRICYREGVTKKTIVGPDRWESVKSQLISAISQLQQVIWADKENPESKKLALDVICTDVTKRMRTMETRMTLAEAKNALGVNPEESREIRSALYEVLRDARFTCKSEASPQEWEDLKRRWSERSELVRNITAAARADQGKTRALEVLARDVMKRARDDRTRKDPKRTQDSQTSPTQATYGLPDRGTSKTGQFDGSPQAERVDLCDSMASSNFDAMSDVSHASPMQYGPSGGSMPSHLPMSLQSQSSSLSDSPDGLSQPHRVLGSSIPASMQLDSSLLLAANTQTPFMDQQYVQHQYAAATSSAASVFSSVQSVTTSFAIYLRLHPSSTFVTNTTLWIATMGSQSLQELRHVAVDKFPEALCVRIEGILKDDKGGELPLQIEQDQELGAYLAHMQGNTPTFSVQLVWKTP